MTDGPVTAAVIVAAGRGVRARSAAGPKQYAVVGGRPVVAHTIAAFLAHPSIDCVQVVIHADDTDHYVTAVAGLEPSLKLLGPVHGGATRQASVLAGLEALVGVAPGLVLIHDAARPFVDAATIARVVAALGTDVAAIAASPIADTLKRGDGEKFVAATVSRDDLWRAQTPQGFRFAAILDAHRRAAEDAIATLTDDAAVAEWAGIPVRLVEGAAANTKLTTPQDLVMADRQLRAIAAPDIRTGQGFDVHRFTAGDHVMLAGVRIPHSHGVEAHSDGDVALHAITDALLGAIADGDIGLHFKNTDPRWRGAASDQFLAEARRRVEGLGGRIANVDVTILCEAPKIAPHRDAMRARIAAILGIGIGRVAVKATTTEGLGFPGRGEGLAAMALATVILG